MFVETLAVVILFYFFLFIFSPYTLGKRMRKTVSRFRAGFEGKEDQSEEAEK